MGLRDRQLFGYRRAAWIAALTDPATDLLALVGPHPFTPFALTATRETAASLGLSPATVLEADGDRAEVHRVDPTAAASRTPTSPSTCRPPPPRRGSTSPAELAATAPRTGLWMRARSSTAIQTPSRRCWNGSGTPHAQRHPVPAR